MDKTGSWLEDDPMIVRDANGRVLGLRGRTGPIGPPDSAIRSVADAFPPIDPKALRVASDEIEVTPEMLWQGKLALYEHILGWDDAPSEHQDLALAAAFRAMLAAKNLRP